MVFRRLAALSAALAFLGLAGAAHAQDYPSRTVKIVVAFPAGGPTDFVARVLADKLKGALGQSVIIENKPGANAAIGAESVAKSDPDGYTLFFTTAGAVVINPHMRANLPYDPIKDFAPITLVVNTMEVLVVKSDTPMKSATDLVAFAKSRPDGIAMASTGVGSPPHLALELFKSSSGANVLHVPYRGAAPAVTDVVGGQVHAMFADLPVLMPQIRARSCGIPQERAGALGQGGEGKEHQGRVVAGRAHVRRGRMSAIGAADSNTLPWGRVFRACRATSADRPRSSDPARACPFRSHSPARAHPDAAPR